MKFVIFISTFIEPNTKTLHIGGLQTYIDDLAKLAVDSDFDVLVVQSKSCGTIENLEYNGYMVKMYPQKIDQKLFNSIYSEFNSNESVFVVSTDQLDIKSSARNVISIQHGVAFDIPGNMIGGFWGKNRILQHVNKALRCIKNVRRFYMTMNTVCVDYNYYNWFRTFGTIPGNKRVYVIPNYSVGAITHDELIEKLHNKRQLIKIVFSRRFVEYRGSILFSVVIKRILSEYDNIDVTFAGEGPCEKEIKNILNRFPNVHFTQYSAQDSISFHKHFDIAVIPTIYSEGTSLSLCEAMSAGLFPICTNVGGLSNMVLDHYNGLLCMPEEDELYNAIKEAITMNENTFNEIVENAYNCAISSFGIERWRKRWKKLIMNLQNYG